MSAMGTIIKKEWMDVRKNKLVLSVVLFVPLLMTAIPLVMMGIMGRVGVSQGDLEEMGAMLQEPDLPGAEPGRGDAVDDGVQLPGPLPDDAADGAGDHRGLQHRRREGDAVAGAAAGDADQHDEVAAGEGAGGSAAGHPERLDLPTWYS